MPNVKNNKMQPANNTPPKPKLEDAVNSKQKQEIIILVGVLFLIAIFLYFFMIKPSGSEEPPAQKSPIETDFSTDALDKVRERDNEAPTVETGNSGKNNPFSSE